MGVFFFFLKHIFVDTYITYVYNFILAWIVLIWVFIVNVFYNVILGFLKIHCQYGSNVHLESYIDLNVIFNYIRELFF